MTDRVIPGGSGKARGQAQIRGQLARPDPALSRLARLADIEGWRPYRYKGDPDWTPGRAARRTSADTTCAAP